MADRSVTIRLKAEISAFKAAMAEAASASKSAAAQIDQAFAKVGAQGAEGAQRAGDAYRRAGTDAASSAQGIGEAYGAAGVRAGEAAEGVKSPWADAGDTAEKSADGVGQAYDVAGAEAKAAADGIKPGWEQAGDAAAQSADGVGQAYDEAGDAAAAAAQDVRPPWEQAGDSAEHSADGVGEAYDQAGDQAAAAAHDVAEPWNQAGTTAESSADGVGQAYAEAGADAANAADGVATPWEQAGQAGEQAGHKTGQSFDEAGTKAEGAGERAGSVWASMGSSVTGSINGVIAKQREHSAEWDTIANRSAIAGGAVVGAVGLVVKSAMSWESAWAGVTKTVDGTPQQLKAVEDGLRGMARELPASHQDLAAVAEAAGQLGVQTPHVLAFTRTMIDMGESTNLSAEDAATSIARFTNIMGTVGEVGESAYSRVGSALVRLGNNFATTEREIVEMSLRLAGAGAQMNMTEGDVLGIAAAMSSVGIEAEAGGTAMSMSLKKIDNAVRTSSTELETFARISGTSAEEFTNTWRENPAQALDSFVQGLGRVKDEGGSVSQVLTELGIRGIREQDAFLRLAGASDILTSSLHQSNDGFRENIDRVEEAGKRYETTESRARIAWNSIQDAAVTAGAAILPAVAGMADALAGLAGWFSSLPQPVMGTVVAIAGLAGAAALAVGGGMKLIAWLAQTKAALDTLGVATTGLGGKLSKVGKYAAGAAAGFAVLQGLGAVFSRDDVLSVDQMTNAMSGAEFNVSRLDDAFRNADFVNGRGRWSLEGTVSGIDGIGSAIARINDSGGVDHLTRVMGGLTASTPAVGKLAKSLGNVDESLAGMFRDGNTERAAQAFRSIAEEAEKSGVPLEVTAKLFPQLRDAVIQYANSLNVTLTPQEQLQAMMGDLPPKLLDAAESAQAAGGGLEGAAGAMGLLGGEAADTQKTLDDVMQSLRQLGEINMTAAEATGAYHESLRELHGALAENAFAFDEATGMLDTTTESGYAAQKAFNELGRAGWDMAEAMAKQGASQAEVQNALRTTYDDLVDTGVRFGLTSEQADSLARAVLGIEPEVSIDSWMSDAAKQMAEGTQSSLSDIERQIAVRTWMGEDIVLQAVRSRAAVLDIPESDAVDSWMSSVAENKANDTTAAILRIPKDTRISSWMSENALNTARETARAIERIPTFREVQIKVIESHQKFSLGGVEKSQAGYSAGGSVIEGLRGMAAGGLVPGTPPADPTADNVFARVADTGELIKVRSQEFIANEPAARKNRAWLEWMNAGGVMPGSPRGFAAGTPASTTAPRGFPARAGGADEIAAAVHAAMRSWQPVVNLGGRETYGFMKQVERRYGPRA
ncbi:phage tail tape measure protein [Rothia sp. AR01]|uniref:Phage tail tape measure protein n=1 Tax=Rothia santali TaxID=2949643 RepID=A0A9X2HEZ4_9MICC|nr:phage tail tape measure protein [Rothia santali]MCP3426034.1 phage tail tape measure protein [Rothia santali]